MNREIVRPALGNIVPVGTFYDARRDSFLSQSLIKDEFAQSIVTKQSKPSVVIEVDHQNRLVEKFKRLGIDGDLGASILSGLVDADGLERFILANSEDRPQLQSTVYHTIVTTQDRLEFGSPDFRESIALPASDAGDVTHVVVEIQLGVQTIIVNNRWLRPHEEQTAVETQLHSDVDDFVSSIRDQQPRRLKDVSDSFDQVVGYSTIPGSSQLILNGLNEAKTYLDLLPSQVRTQATGEGTPITYRLIPIKMLEFFGVPAINKANLTVSVSSECLRKFCDLFDEFEVCGVKLKKYGSYMSRYKAYLDPAASSNVSNRATEIDRAASMLKRELGEKLLEVRRGANPDELWQLLRKFGDGDSSPGNLARVQHVSQDKLTFIDELVGKGATYVGYGTSRLEIVLRNSRKPTAYVLFFAEANMQDQDSWHATHKLFVKLLQDLDSNTFLAIVDCDATASDLQKAVVTQYEDGQKVVADLLEQQQYISQQCFARYEPRSLENQDIKRPLDRRFVKIVCPGRECSKDDVRDWRCSECDAPLEYGFSDRYIYCDCGRASYDTYEFKCNHDNHGTSYAKYDARELLAYLKSLDQSNYLNILILGETGVGKSTFINAFVNYLYFKSLEDALQHDDLHWVIPCSFATQTMDRANPGSPIIQQKIQVGARDDERDGSTGQSATQQTQVYPITVGSWTYRLIDTPGIGDTRGLDFDKKNCTDILNTISGYDYLHGIIILLKSNSARLTIHFAFCVKELLTHLHRDATNNVVWGFTNTRISNYMPGDTYGSLQTLLAQRPDIGLSLASSSVYCFDSESFRYLAAAKNGVTMDNKQDFESSWGKSSDEAHRMLEHFTTRQPHPVKSTTSLNGTRNLIKELTKPMAEISKLIRDNIDLCVDEVKQLGDAKLTGDKLKTKLHPEKTLMRQAPLPKPRTVCSDASCVEHKDDGTGNGTMLADYPNPCHPVCYLTNITVEVRADPGLINCWAMQGRENCHQCGHHYTLHLHIMYELETYKTTIIDLGIEKQLKDHASDIELKRSAIKTRESLIEDYKKERETIQIAAAKFGLFMKKNSILPYNDATVAYLDMLIDSEQAKVDAGGGRINKNSLKSLQDDKQRHIELVDVLEKSMQGHDGGPDKAISQDEVNKIVRQLYQLRHFGENLRNLKTDIAYTHAMTNRENPHRVKSHYSGRRGGGLDGSRRGRGGGALSAGSMRVVARQPSRTQWSWSGIFK